MSTWGLAEPTPELRDTMRNHTNFNVTCSSPFSGQLLPPSGACSTRTYEGRIFDLGGLFWVPFWKQVEDPDGKRRGKKVRNTNKMFRLLVMIQFKVL